LNAYLSTNDPTLSTSHVRFGSKADTFYAAAQPDALLNVS